MATLVRKGKKAMVTSSGYVHKRSFKAHKDVVNCFVIGETYLFTASNDKTIKKWSLEGGVLIATLGMEDSERKLVQQKRTNNQKHEPDIPGHEQGVCSLCLSDDFLYSGSFDCTIKKWNITDHSCITTFRGHSEAVYAVCVGAGFVLSGSRDMTIKVWNEQEAERDSEGRNKDGKAPREREGKCTATLKGHTGPVLAIIVQDRMLYSGSDDSTIKLWDWRSGAEVRTYVGHQAGVTAVKVADPSLYSTSFDATLRVWHLKTAQCLRVCRAESGLKSLDLGGGKLFGAGNNACMYVWDLQSTSEKPLTVDRLARAGLTSIILEGNTVYSSSADNVVRQWEKVSSTGTAIGGPDSVGGAGKLSLPPGSKKAFMGDLADEDEEGEEAKGIVKPDLGENMEELKREGKLAPNVLNIYSGLHTDKVHAVSAYDGRLYTASSDNTIGVASMMEGLGEEEGIIPIRLGATGGARHTDRVLCLEVSPDGMSLFSGSADKTIRKWNVPFGSNQEGGPAGKPLQGHSDWVSCLHICEGSLYSGSWDGSIRKWDVTALRFIQELSGHRDPVYCLASSGGVLFSGSRDCTVRAWNLDGGECIRVYEGHQAAVSALVVKDPHLFTASWDKTVRAWDAATGTPLKNVVFPPFGQAVLCLELGGGCLYAGGSDMTVWCFSLSPSVKLQRKYRQHTQAVNSLCLYRLQDSSILYSASDDGTVVAWEAKQGAHDDSENQHQATALLVRIQTATPPPQKAPNSLSARLTEASAFLTRSDVDDGRLPNLVAGYLFKQGQLFKRWSKRYFTLSKGMLLCYAEEPRAGSKPLDHVIMKDLLSVMPLSEDAHVPSDCRGMTLSTLDRKHVLAAPEKDYKEWLAALSKYVENNQMMVAIKQKRNSRKY